ncbi:TIGR00282 family metallophosphoesterase [Desulfovibrio subterraneus]|uniref:TIGR00282 family metallophosphoesterase n=1 Tax=Desulfovibrio subterraneus TaxID=2718620 RepID=UPI0022B86858|nr:TIGR00282 family metallophosphoesterase [Desulfovibrio subterraneus]WBF68968.1 TIGR00282 family metallophosphoesterase [Desulfovibrio subterraneus]
MRILFFGDVMGKPGRVVLKRKLPELRERLGADMVIANGENASGGVGLTTDVLRELLGMGVDVVTTGNHIWKHREMYSGLEREQRVVRPANYPAGAPGRGMTIVELASGHRVAVLNLQGRTFMDDVDCPFHVADALLKTLPDDVCIRFIDFHAEATSEKKALGWYLDGRISALVGTHTHVQTADPMILPEGTGYLTDAGMCGVEASCLGMDKDVIVTRFLTKLPQRFILAKGDVTVNGVLVEVDPATGKAVHIELVRE